MTSWTWPNIYLLLGALMALLMCATCLANEPQIDREALLEKITAKDTKQSPVFHWIQTTLVTPFAEFFNRNGVKLAASFLLFIFLFKIGEAFLGRMSMFYKEIGFSNSDIATYSKLLNWWVTIVFSLLGGLVNIRYGIYRGLMIAGVAMAASNLLFALIAQAGLPHLF